MGTRHAHDLDLYIPAPTTRPILRACVNIPGALLIFVGLFAVLVIDLCRDTVASRGRRLPDALLAFGVGAAMWPIAWARDLRREGRACPRCEGTRHIHACGADCPFPGHGACAYVPCDCDPAGPRSAPFA